MPVRVPAIRRARSPSSGCSISPPTAYSTGPRSGGATRPPRGGDALHDAGTAGGGRQRRLPQVPGDGARGDRLRRLCRLHRRAGGGAPHRHRHRQRDQGHRRGPFEMHRAHRPVGPTTVSTGAAAMGRAPPPCWPRSPPTSSTSRRRHPGDRRPYRPGADGSRWVRQPASMLAIRQPRRRKPAPAAAARPPSAIQRGWPRSHPRRPMLARSP